MLVEGYSQDVNFNDILAYPQKGHTCVEVKEITKIVTEARREGLIDVGRQFIAHLKFFWEILLFHNLVILKDVGISNKLCPLEEDIFQLHNLLLFVSLILILIYLVVR